MNKIIAFALVAAVLYPSAAHAAWWSPFSWIVGKSEPKAAAAVSAEGETASTTAAYIDPTIGELQRRIVELEDKLEKALAGKGDAEAQAKVATAIAKAVQATPSASSASADSSGLSESDIVAKVRPAIVSFDTATSSGSGVIIDSEGKVLVSARVALSYNSKGEAVGIAKTASVTFASGKKGEATLVGFNESRDVAAYQLSNPGGYPYVKSADVNSVKAGDKAFVLASAASRVNSGGSDIAAATVAGRSGDTIEISSPKRPLDHAAALVNGKGEFVAIPKNVSCKVVEEGEKCLTYKTTATAVSSALPKVLAGMKLYVEKRDSSKTEELIEGQLSGIARNTKESGALSYASSSLTGKNSFDNFNGRLVNDQEGAITKLYLTKLKVGADTLAKGVDFLKEQAHDIDVFFIENSAVILTLDPYQKAVLSRMETENRAKFKEYEAKVNYWTAKKNEYDGFITNYTEASHDYLLLEGAAMQKAVSYITTETKRVLDSVSSETVGLF